MVTSTNVTANQPGITFLRIIALSLSKMKGALSTSRAFDNRRNELSLAAPGTTRSLPHYNFPADEVQENSQQNQRKQCQQIGVRPLKEGILCRRPLLDVCEFGGDRLL